jgi:hypothetical protein
MFTYHVGIRIIKDNIFNQWTLHIQCKFHLSIFLESNQSINWMWLFFQNQNARVKCLFSHPNVFIINPLSYIALYFVILVSLTQTILLIKRRALALSGLIIEWQHSPPPPLDK